MLVELRGRRSNNGCVSGEEDASWSEIADGQLHRRQLVQRWLETGEQITWDARAICTKAPAPHLTPQAGSIVIATHHLIYVANDDEVVSLPYGQIEPPAVVKVGRRMASMSFVTMDGSAWAFETDRVAIRITQRKVRQHRQSR